MLFDSSDAIAKDIISLDVHKILQEATIVIAEDEKCGKASDDIYIPSG